MITIPERGEFLSIPPVDEWEAAAKQNNLLLGSISLPVSRESFQNAVLKTSKIYMENLGLKIPVIKPSSSLVISGHQPHLFHAGIFYKYSLLSKISKSVNALWVSVDTDPCDSFPVRIPSFAGSPAVVIRKMAPSSISNFYQTGKVEESELLSFKESVIKDLATLPTNRFKYGAEFLSKSSNGSPELMRDLMLLWRLEYAKDAKPDVWEVPLSEICRSEEFFKFVFYLLENSEILLKSFNSAVDDYRKEHGIRSRANPFPDLAMEDGSLETIFWKVKGNEREPLFVRKVGDQLEIKIDKWIKVESSASLMSLCKDNSLQIWPRAVALSILQRVFIGDLFVHGIGGSKYDQITDKLIEELFAIKPPVFSVASSTPPADGLKDPSGKLAELHRKIRDIKFHPEEELKGDPDVEAILQDKVQLIADIKKASADKKTIGNRISSINEMLMEKLKPVEDSLLAEVREVEKEMAAFNVVSDRELPFFLYPPESLFSPQT